MATSRRARERLDLQRCKCPARYSAQGKRLACPKRHGTWYYIIDVALSAEVRARTGATVHQAGRIQDEDEAGGELRQVIRLLELADPSDDETRLQIAELIRDHYKGYGQLPAYEDVRRRLRSGWSAGQGPNGG